MLLLGQFSETQTDTVTSSSQTFTANGSTRKHVVFSERNVHIKIGPTATVDDFPLLENQHAQVWLEPGDMLAYILADGESDGKIWLTEIS